MNSGSLKVPLDENFFEDDRKRRRNRSFMSIGFCFLTFLSVIAFIFSIYTYMRLQQLEYEMNLYRVKTQEIANVLEDDLYESIDKFENEENFEEETYVTPPTDRHYEYYDEYESVDETNNNNNAKPDGDNEVTRIILAGDFIKSADVNPDDSKTRRKRNVVAATQDGVLINSESYADVKRKNHSIHRTSQDLHITPIVAQPSVFGSTFPFTSTKAPPQVYSRASRVMHGEEKPKPHTIPIKKSMLRSSDSSTEEYSPDSTFTIPNNHHRRRYRNRAGHLENFDESRVTPRIGRIKPLPSIRLDGDTSKYVYGQHMNFNGNGHLRHPRKTYIDWKTKDWVYDSGMNQHFDMNDDGEMTIKESGLYFIYAQIYYLDEHDTNGYRVYKNKDYTVLQCTTSAHTQERIVKGNTCYTAGAEYLAENDVITISDIFDGRYSLFEPGKSFFGLIKLGDMKIK